MILGAYLAVAVFGTLWVLGLLVFSYRMVKLDNDGGAMVAFLAAVVSAAVLAGLLSSGFDSILGLYK